MNMIQKALLGCYAVLVLLMIMVPPFVVVYNNLRLLNKYSFIWEPIKYDNRIVGEIELSKLLIQLLGLTLITIALFLIFKDNKGRGSSS